MADRRSKNYSVLYTFTLWITFPVESEILESSIPVSTDLPASGKRWHNTILW
jgi:hypothetical protein